MPILNIYFDKIKAERERELKGKLSANVSLTFKDVEEKKIDVKDRKLLLFNFVFTLTYEKLAKIEFEGYVTFSDEAKKAKELMKNWKKDKEFMKQLYNYTLTKCNLKALMLEEQLGLPLHIPMPRLR